MRCGPNKLYNLIYYLYMNNLKILKFTASEPFLHVTVKIIGNRFTTITYSTKTIKILLKLWVLLQ